MSPMILVLVAFLMSGDFKWQALPVHDQAECLSAAHEIIDAEREKNKTEDDKILRFGIRCDEFVVPQEEKAPALSEKRGS